MSLTIYNEVVGPDGQVQIEEFHFLPAETTEIDGVEVVSTFAQYARPIEGHEGLWVWVAGGNVRRDLSKYQKPTPTGEKRVVVDSEGNQSVEDETEYTVGPKANYWDPLNLPYVKGWGPAKG